MSISGEERTVQEFKKLVLSFVMLFLALHFFSVPATAATSTPSELTQETNCIRIWQPYETYFFNERVQHEGRVFVMILPVIIDWGHPSWIPSTSVLQVMWRFIGYVEDFCECNIPPIDDEPADDDSCDDEPADDNPSDDEPADDDSSDDEPFDDDPSDDELADDNPSDDESADDDPSDDEPADDNPSDDDEQIDDSNNKEIQIPASPGLERNSTDDDDYEEDSLDDEKDLESEEIEIETPEDDVCSKDNLLVNNNRTEGAANNTDASIKYDAINDEAIFIDESIDELITLPAPPTSIFNHPAPVIVSNEIVAEVGRITAAVVIHTILVVSALSTVAVVIKMET